MNGMIDRATAWLKSTRSIVVIIMVVGMTIGLFAKVISAEQFMNAAMIAVGAYFGRGDTATKK